jgi:hypothetical protein
MTIQVVNGVRYYKAEYVKEVCPAFFVGCMRSVRKLVDRKKIPENGYMFATFIKSSNTWKPSCIEVNKAALLLTEEWVKENVPRFGNKEEKDLSVEMAPPLLELTDDEKFKDVDGNVLEVEVRGERHPDKIFFYGKDIERILSIAKIQDILNDKTSNYEENIHYKKFIRSHTGTPGGEEDKTCIRTIIFLSYRGLIRMLMTRRNPIAKLFEDWAINILFTHHLGTVQQKEELASNLLGSTVESVRDFLSTSPSKYSEIYLICIGKATDLKDSLPLKNTYSENELVFKYGYTDDLSRRLNEHRNKFSKINGTNISVILHSPIDPKFLSKAELELKEYFQDEESNVVHPVYKELVIMNEKQLKGARREFKDICCKYAGCMERIQDEMNKLKNDFETERKAREKELENEKKAKEKELENERKAREKEIDNERKAREKELENEKKAREKEIDNERKIHAKELENEVRIKELEIESERKLRQLEIENEKRYREQDRLEFNNIIETLKKEHKETVENIERKNKELLDYFVGTLKQFINK